MPMHEPKTRTPSPAEYFKGAYSEEEIEARETRERLSQLQEAGRPAGSGEGEHAGTVSARNGPQKARTKRK